MGSQRIRHDLAHTQGPKPLTLLEVGAGRQGRAGREPSGLSTLRRASLELYPQSRVLLYWKPRPPSAPP